MIWNWKEISDVMYLESLTTIRDAKFFNIIHIKYIDVRISYNKFIAEGKETKRGFCVVSSNTANC